MSDDTDNTRKVHRLKQQEIERENNPAKSGSIDPNEIRVLLQGNIAAANDAGMNLVAPPPRRRSRRTRDYVIVMTLVNPVLVVATLIAPILGGSGLVIFNLSFTWAMWFLISDY